MNNELAKLWQKQFEEKNGRKPSVEEFTEAKNNGFAGVEENVVIDTPVVSESTPTFGAQPAVDPKKAWAADFEAKYGRKPEMVEFNEAKANGFAIEEAPVVSEPTPEVPVADVTPEPQPAVDPMKVWAAKFEAQNGRKPVMDDFNEAKKTGFTTVQSVQPMAQPVQPAMQAAAPQMAQMPQAPQPPRKPMSLKSKILLGLGVIVLLALGGGYAWGQNHFSKDSEAARLGTSLATQKAATYAGVMKWSDTEKNLTKAEVEPAVRYMKQENYNDADKIADALARNDLSIMKLEEKGRNYLIFPRYELVVKPVTITAESNQNQLNLKVNGVDEGKVSGSKRLSHRAPGVYAFEATSRIGNKDVPVKDSRVITKDETIGLNIEVVSFDVESNLKTGDLYIGETKIGTLKDGKYKVKNQPITEEMEVYVAQNLGNKKIESERKELTRSNDHSFITLDADGVLTESDARSVLESAMNAVDSYAYDERIPSNMDMFTSGSSNTSFQNFKSNVDHNLNNARRTANTIDYAFKTLRSVSQTSETTADFVGEIEVDFYFTSDTDKKNRTSGRLSQTFEISGTLSYDSSSKKWMVDSISDKQPKLHESSNVS